MQPNRIRDKLNAGEPTLATHVHTTWPGMIEVIGLTGIYDYVEFVAEYAPFNLHDLENFCRHSRYYVASDMPNGGYTFDDWTIEKHEETDPVIQYHRLFAETSTLREALVGRIDIRRRDYEYSRINMKESRTQQANYLYSCRKFADFVPAFRTFLSGQDSEYGVFDDLYDYMVAHRAGDDLLGLFDNIFLHRADNRDFFEWDQSANGMLMPSPAR